MLLRAVPTIRSFSCRGGAGTTKSATTAPVSSRRTPLVELDPWSTPRYRWAGLISLIGVDTQDNSMWFRSLWPTIKQPNQRSSSTRLRIQLRRGSRISSVFDCRAPITSGQEHDQRRHRGSRRCQRRPASHQHERSQRRRARQKHPSPCTEDSQEASSPYA